VEMREGMGVAVEVSWTAQERGEPREMRKWSKGLAGHFFDCHHQDSRRRRDKTAKDTTTTTLPATTMSNSPVTTPQPATPIEKTTTVESTLPTLVEGAVPAEQPSGESKGEASEAVGAVAPSGDSRITKMLERELGATRGVERTY
jgi:hypothetical protein